MMIVPTIILGLLLICAMLELRHRRISIEKYSMKLDKITDKLSQTANTLASIRVKHGQTWENFLPLMAVFEKELGPKENATFLGQPIDLIYFNENEIVFVEVKTGNSKLSQRQRSIRNLVKDKKIRWSEVNDAFQSASLDKDRIQSSKMMQVIPHRNTT